MEVFQGQHTRDNCGLLRVGGCAIPSRLLLVIRWAAPRKWPGYRHSHRVDVIVQLLTRRH
jgi:hypothetical protein